MKKTIRISGMSCGHCVAAVTRALEGLSGVSKVSVSLEENRAEIECSEAVLDEEIKSVIEEEGYDITEIQ